MLEVCADIAGGVVIMGAFHGSLDFGGGPIVSQPWVDWTSQTVDIYAARFDSLGQHTWSRVIASADYMRARSMAIDAEGNHVLVGEFSGTLDLKETTLTSSFGDAFVAKLDAEGNLLWAKRFDISGGFGNAAEDVAIDANSNIVMIGTFSGRMNFGGGVLQSLGSYDVFLVKLDPSGGHIWSRRFGGAEPQRGERLAIDARGNVNVAGHFYNSIDLGGGSLTAISDQELFLASFDSLATHVWSRAIRGSTHSFNLRFDASDSGDVAFGCLFGTSIELGGEVLFGPGTVAVVFDPAGIYRWRFYPGNETISGVSFDEDGGLVVSGEFYGSMDLAGTPMTSVGPSDGFIAHVGTDGALDWATQLGGAGRDVASSMIRPGGDLWVDGGFTDGIDLGEVHYDGRAGFLARFGRRPPAPVLDVSLIPIPGAIEVRWNVATEQPLDTLTILRAESPAPLQPIFSAPYGSGSGSFVDQDVAGGRKYDYQLAVTTPQGLAFRSSVVTVTATVPMLMNALAQNAPNPFNPTTSITYSLNSRAEVSISIYDATGVRVRRIDQGVRDAGEYSVEWNGRDDAGTVVGTGVYFYRLDGVAGVAPRKMVLLK